MPVNIESESRGEWDTHGYNNVLMQLIYVMHYTCREDIEELGFNMYAKELVSRSMKKVDCSRNEYLISSEELDYMYGIVDSNPVVCDVNGIWSDKISLFQCSETNIIIDINLDSALEGYYSFDTLYAKHDMKSAKHVNDFIKLRKVVTRKFVSKQHT